MNVSKAPTNTSAKANHLAQEPTDSLAKSMAFSIFLIYHHAFSRRPGVPRDGENH